jgi:hypothetical protein
MQRPLSYNHVMTISFPLVKQATLFFRAFLP